jgi:hypothetical protein
MYRFGSGVQEDYTKALEYYKEAAKKGNYFAFSGMAVIFLEKSHAENARKAIQKMIEGGEADGWTTNLDYTNRHIQLIERVVAIASYSPKETKHEIYAVVRQYIPQVMDLISSNLGADIYKSFDVKQRKLQLVGELQEFAYVVPPALRRQ